MVIGTMAEFSIFASDLFLSWWVKVSRTWGPLDLLMFGDCGGCVAVIACGCKSAALWVGCGLMMEERESLGRISALLKPHSYRED